MNSPLLSLAFLGLQSAGALAGPGSPEPAATAQDAEQDREEPPAEVSEGEIFGPDGEVLSEEEQRRLRELFDDEDATFETERPDPIETDGAILVQARKPRGLVRSSSAPLRSLNPDDVRAIGATNVGEVLDALDAELGNSSAGSDPSPTVLLNGRRVANFQEIATIPSEAIERLDIFPEEVALQYGYSVDQKVVNVVTFENFSAKIGSARFSETTDPGYPYGTAALTYFRIAGNTRISLDGGIERSGALLESERDPIQLDADDRRGRFRTLLPATRQLRLGGTVSGEWLPDISTSLSARLADSDDEFLLGPGVDGPVVRNIARTDIGVGGLASGTIARWSWTIDAGFDHAETRVRTDSDGLSNADRDVGYSSGTFRSDALVSGSPLSLPAGPLSTSLRIGYRHRDFDSSTGSELPGMVDQSFLSRETLDAQLSLDIPLIDDTEPSPVQLGRVAANLTARVERVSDFGWLRTATYGLAARPVEPVNIIASVTHRERAPELEHLGSTQIVTENARTFDFARGETVEFTRIFEGNPDLRAQDERIFRLGVSVRPVEDDDFLLSLDVSRSTTDDAIAPFPVNTPSLEQAYPERFARGPDGDLLAINSAPINFASASRTTLRLGVSFSRPLDKSEAGASSGERMFFGSREDMEKALPAGAIVVDVAPGSIQAQRFRRGASRIAFSLYHTVALQDDVRLFEGGPTLDLLAGDAVGIPSSHVHRIQLRTSIYKDGIGGNVDVDWRSKSRVEAIATTAGTGANDLTFDEFGQIDVGVFVDLSQRYPGDKLPGWLRGTQVSLDIENVLNERQQVRDGRGVTPLEYQAARLTPLGRRISLTLRKRF